MMCLGWASLLQLLSIALAESPVPMLRGSGRGLTGLPSCAEKPNFHLARASWCGEQKEPMACSKELENPNPVWDCHLQADTRLPLDSTCPYALVVVEQPNSHMCL